MIHLKPAEGTTRFLCCFQSSLMLAPGDGMTEDPAHVTCSVEIEYEAFEKILIAPMDRHKVLAESIQTTIWEMLVDRRINNTFQVEPNKRRAFLEEFGKRVRKLEETDESAGKDLLLSIRSQQTKELKRIGKAFREHSANLSTLLIKILTSNPTIPLEEIPAPCLNPGPECGHADCAKRAAMIAHNNLSREIEKLLTVDPLA